MSVDDDTLLRRAADTRFVLLGEASQGAHEFYRERAEITRRLIADEGFTAVAVEGDWPDAYRVNLFVRGASDDDRPEEALSDYRRFPAWMWRRDRYSCFDHFGPDPQVYAYARAVEPLEVTSEWEAGELPETYPWAV